MIQDHIRQAIAGMPVGIEPEVPVATRALYAPLHVGVSEGVSLDADIAYGPHPRHRLDVRHLKGHAHSAVLIYVHGGGFTGGDKTAFANIGATFATRGVLGITMTYRLSPEANWPAGAQDIDRAVAWVKANAASYNADASRIVVFGHSAGASHAATFLFDLNLRGHNKVAGGVLVSGPGYSLQQGMVRGNLLAYFGADESRYERQSVTRHVAGTKVPVVLAVAEHDPGYLVTPALELAIALTARDGRCPPLYRLDGHNHFSPPSSIGTSDDELAGAIMRLIKGLG
jgi:acetyl esterase